MTDWTNPDEREAAVAKKWADAEAALAAANERIRELEGRPIPLSEWQQMEAALAAERAISDKLAEALRELRALVRGECPSLLNEDSGGNGELDIEIDATLAEIAAIRKAENPAVKTYCGGKPNYVQEDKA